jgi:hypothetical protein
MYVCISSLIIYKNLTRIQIDVGFLASFPSLPTWRWDNRSSSHVLFSEANFRRREIPECLPRSCNPHRSCLYSCVDTIQPCLGICHDSSLCANLLDPHIPLYQNQSQRCSSGRCSVSTVSMRSSSLLMFTTDIVQC